ncbi:hypothetical protein AB5I41_10035 [Sphingomonas sp. MMS24-JH45]
MALGLALCVVTATGTSLRLQKRRRRGLRSERLTAAWQMVVWGAPLVLVATLWLRAVVGPEAPLITVFWGSLGVGIVAAAALPTRIAALPLRTTTLVAVVATAVGHAVLLRPGGSVLALDGIASGLALATLLALRDCGRTLRHGGVEQIAVGRAGAGAGRRRVGSIQSSRLSGSAGTASTGVFCGGTRACAAAASFAAALFARSSPPPPQAASGSMRKKKCERIGPTKHEARARSRRPYAKDFRPARRAVETTRRPLSATLLATLVGACAYPYTPPALPPAERTSAHGRDEERARR